MRILNWNALDRPGRRAALERPSAAAREDITATARSIIERVRQEGDYALIDLTLKYDRVRLDSLVVPAREISHAQKPLGAENVRALKRAIANIRRFHAAQV